MPYDVVPTPPVSQPTASQAVDGMIGEVASLIGGDDDPEARAKALAFLDRAVDHLNMNGIVSTQRTEATFSTMTLGDTTLTLPSDWGWPDDRAFVYDTSNRLLAVMEWKVWEDFRQFISPTSSAPNGVPTWLSIRSDLTDQLIYFWSPVDTGKVGKIILPYYKRVQTLSEVSTFTAPKEIREALIMYAEFLMMRYRYKDKPPIWQPFEADAERTMRKAINSTRRATEGGQHFAARPDLTGLLGASTDTFTGVIYLVLGR
jgi:hypothetical protein